MKKAFRKPWQAFLFPGVYFLNVGVRFGIGVLFYSGFVGLFLYELINTRYEPILPSLGGDFFGTLSVQHFRDSLIHNMQLFVDDGGLLYLFRIPMLLGHLLLRCIAAHMVKRHYPTQVVISSFHRLLISFTALIGVAGIIHAYSTNHTLRDARVVNRVEALVGGEIEKDLGYVPEYEVYGTRYNEDEILVNVILSEQGDGDRVQMHVSSPDMTFPELYIRYAPGIKNMIQDIVYMTYRNPLKVFKGSSKVIDDYREGNEEVMQEMVLIRTLVLDSAVIAYLEGISTEQDWFMLSSESYENEKYKESTVVCNDSGCRAKFYVMKGDHTTEDVVEFNEVGTIYVQAIVDNRFFTPTYIVVVDNASLEKTVLLDTLSDEEEKILYEMLENNEKLSDENSEEVREI